MGIYLCDIKPDDWAAEPERREALDAALAERGLPSFPGPANDVPPAVSFEEKMSPGMTAFAELCDRRGITGPLEASLIIPLDLPELIELPVGSSYDDVTVVCGAPQLLAAMTVLSGDVALPAELPTGDLALTNALSDGDPAAYYVAVFRAAAEFSLRYASPLAYF